MTATETIQPKKEKTVSTREDSKAKRLIELAERDSLRRDFEILRERHGSAKKKTPK